MRLHHMNASWNSIKNSKKKKRKYFMFAPVCKKAYERWAHNVDP